MAAETGFWIFAYGSLMWNPGFPYLEVQPARIHGYHRAFCIVSHHYRGTSEKPGVVLGLDRGGSCMGRAYRIAPDKEKEIVDYLYEREMLHYVYDIKDLMVRLADGRRVRAHTYVAARGEDRYAGQLTPEQAAHYILQGHGISGSNREYLESTVRHLDELGIADGPVHRILKIVRRGG